MKDGFIRCAAASPEIRVADCAYNALSILHAIERARQDRVKVLVFPELSLTGSTCGDLFLQPSLINSAYAALELILAKTASLGMLILIGMPVRAGGVLCSAAVVLCRGKILGAVPNAAPAGRIFAMPQNTDAVLLPGGEVPFGKDLLFTCETVPDLTIGAFVGDPVDGNAAAVSGAATLVAFLSSCSEQIDSSKKQACFLSEYSRRVGAACILALPGEGESTTDSVFSGRNRIFENGVLLSSAGAYTNGYIYSEPDMQFLAAERIRLRRAACAPERTARFTLPQEKTPLSRPCAKQPFVPADKDKCAERCMEIFEIQARGLAKRLRHTGSKAILGISGGVDSTLALMVSLRALDILGRPKCDLIPVTMPCFGTSKRTRSNAETLCTLLGVPCRIIDISASVTAHLADLSHPLDVPDTAFENAQARERTQVLMDLANMENGLVVGTGDLSELALGFATYNGDHMSMYGVNGDVPKTAIRAILLTLADREGGEAGDVLRDIVGTPVSPELLPAKEGETEQITEEVVGPYDLVDFFLYHFLRRAETPGKILRMAEYAFADTYEPEVIEKWLRGFIRRFFAQQFKRSCLPDGPRVGSVCLSPRGAFAMPSDASPGEWLK